MKKDESGTDKKEKKKQGNTGNKYLQPACKR
jgi:hypothetical protein